MTYKHVHYVEFHLDDGLIWDDCDYVTFKADLTLWLASYGEVSDLQAEPDKIYWGGPGYDQAMRTKSDVT